MRPSESRRRKALARAGFAFACFSVTGCETPSRTAPDPTPSASAARSAATPRAPEKVDFEAPAMGTAIHFVAYTSHRLDRPAVEKALRDAHQEIVRIEAVMTSWRDDSEIGAVNQGAGTFVEVGPETLSVVEKSLWASRISEGTFDITWSSMDGVWKFGTAADENPVPPPPALVQEKKKLVDYEQIELDSKERRIKIGRRQKIDLGGIAKGYAIDRAAALLKRAGVESFLAQAGGDLYGAGRKPDGSPWVSGVQDPRGKEGEYFAVIELTDHAFSTAGDYARSFLHEGKRYHHIIDPRTGYPATECRSVTVWAPDALTADAIDDAVFILGPERGLRLVESLDGIGAVIVDAKNRVHVSARLENKVHVRRPPTDAP